MNFKLDENLGGRVVEILRAAGHDVLTVPEQNMCSAPDTDVIEVCRREKRCLITLDMEFANPLLFKPSEFAGIAVLRVPSRGFRLEMESGILTLIEGVKRDSIDTGFGLFSTAEFGFTRKTSLITRAN